MADQLRRQPAPGAQALSLLETLLARPYGGAQEPPSEPPLASEVTAPAPKSSALIVAKRTREGYELEAEVLRQQGRGVLISNSTRQFWVPRGQVRRLKPLVISEWIADRRYENLQFTDPDNLSETIRRERASAPRGPVWYPDVE